LQRLHRREPGCDQIGELGMGCRRHRRWS
jgi:hypothetical protein